MSAGFLALTVCFATFISTMFFFVDSRKCTCIIVMFADYKELLIKNALILSCRNTTPCLS